ncbi:MAG: PorP/SprF family type IX secretion system membrane protein [Flavobacteriia bacterium]|nr:PorP/SprF family type IX secretion system membrane protein [Flavobacteriia bacterium]
MKKCYNIFFISFIFIGSVFENVYGQQLPQFTQWATHQFQFNPAHAGIKPCVDIQTLYRTQWVGITNAPKSGFFTLSVPLQAKRTEYLSGRHGCGVKVEYDRIGQFTTNKVNFAYAGHFNFSKYNRLSLGLYAGYLHFGYDPSISKTIDPDPAIFTEASFVLPDASVGAWWNGENYYAGISLQNLMHSKWKNIGIDSRFRLQTFINGGLRFKMTGGFSLLTGMIIRIPKNGPLSVDVNAVFDYENVFGFGGGYRYTDALMAFCYIKINQQLFIQYSADYGTSPLNRGGFSHEVSINFATCKPVITGPIKTALFQ